jgi:hypothetical protein
MTDDELLAEVDALLQSGDRGESEALEGTPEGTYFWSLTHVEAVPFSLTFTTTVEWGSGIVAGTPVLPSQALSVGAVPPNQ